MNTPLTYAAAACDTMMRKYAAPDLPPALGFHYHQGVLLSGMEKIYRLTADERYGQYIKDWIDAMITPQGNIRGCNTGCLDDLQPGVLLFPLYERTKAYPYREALKTIAYFIEHFPRCENGGFWHQAWCHGQMWLDGLYMAGPFTAMYGAAFGRLDFFDLAAQQATLMRQVTRNEKTGLWYHAWDSTRKAPWCDPETGLSPEFWGRSVGWVPVALLEEADYIPQEHPAWQVVTGIAAELLQAVARYQDEASGLWYQVVDKKDAPGNWPEVSCSCLFASALFKAVRMGLLGTAYLNQAWKGYDGVIRTLRFDGEDLLIGGVCVGTAAGDYKHYVNRPTGVNDLHGVGAFLLMCAEAAQA